MSRKLGIGLVVFLIFFAALVLIARYLLSTVGAVEGFPGRGDRVALIYVEGSIVGDMQGGSSLLSGLLASSVETVRRLEAARKAPSIKAVVLRVNSPGGSAAASQEIYAEIEKVKQDKPVVVSMGDLAASGGYYISSAATKIYANPATLTGSIGVIFSGLEFSGLMEKWGIASQTVTAGEYKDIASMYRKMTPGEREMLQKLVDQVHAQFIAAVVQGRGMDEAEVRKLATGMIMTGEQAKAAGLVDELGGLHEAEAEARRLAKLPEDAPVVSYQKRRSVFDMLDMFGRGSSATSASRSLLDGASSLTRFVNGLLRRDVGAGLISN
ncbi:MAG: hypothetical protein B1H03_06015 [Planctomycetales bacterium 4484_113]|nr:MAG: hypothetical protein B1H03_06015 [Planctomycetales bacterium 4484_113]